MSLYHARAIVLPTYQPSEPDCGDKRQKDKAFTGAQFPPGEDLNHFGHM